MKNNLFKKGWVYGIVLLFVGVAVAPVINADVSKASVNQSSYTPHDPIYILGNDDFTIENGVTGGSGTSDDPFIIEGWEIEASSMDGITIRNVSVYFTIRNCHVHSGDINNDGIVFINVTNGVMENTIITGNRNGVMFRIQYDGKESSENNIIRHNTLTQNNEDAIHFEHTGWSYHSNNIIFNNSISSNKRGIYMVMSMNNQIVYNNILSNYKVGVRLDKCEGGGQYNIIHHNNFIDNGDDGQACEYGDPQNKWDDDYPSGGNYWSDYNGEDNNGDGIGDTPYPIPVDDNEDRYPLMEPCNYENQPPNKPVIDGPTQGKVGVEQSYTITVSEFDGDEIWVIIDWGNGNITDWLGPIASGEELIEHHTWYEKGTYTIKAKAKDKDGESEWAELEVSMPRNKISISTLILRFLERFPLLQRLLNITGMFGL